MGGVALRFGSPPPAGVGYTPTYKAQFPVNAPANAHANEHA